MRTHPTRIPRGRRALGVALAGVLATGALAGPAMAATDDGSAGPECRKAGDKPVEYLTVPSAGADKADVLHVRKSGGEPQGYIIAVL
jgi:hypothetical protein